MQHPVLLHVHVLVTYCPSVPAMGFIVPFRVMRDCLIRYFALVGPDVDSGMQLSYLSIGNLVLQLVIVKITT